MRTVRFRNETGHVRTGSLTEDTIRTAGKEYSFEAVDVLSPVEPTKIICLYGNYVEHLGGSGYEIPEEIPERPQLFLKTPNTVVGHKDVIELPKPGVESDDLEDLGD